VLEAVPNVSEGRNASVIDAIGSAFATSARLLDVHADVDHHRSVFTLAATPYALADALVAGVARAIQLIDLRRHEGVHPRVGVADVVPLVPLRPEEMDRAVVFATEVGRRLGEELGLSVFLYGEGAGGRRPVFYRRGGLAELERRVTAGELAPDFGPPKLDLRSGAVLVGARKPLVAYNVLLGTNDVDVARAIAARVRESGGGMPGVQAIGLRLPGSGGVQVSMNLVDLDRVSLHEVYECVQREGREIHVEVVGGELVGLVPEVVLEQATAAGVEVPGLDESRVLERALRL
jgi:glutamate formiminotransferase/glutamate formiminotransferase/formiminotetrahydrofolate cyclodeaminase